MKFIITTSHIIENYNITDYLGPIIAYEVLGVNFISDTIASMSDFFGGNSGAYRNKLQELKKSVLHELKKQALDKGANAIISFNISFNEISGKGKQMFMATATGTAVKLSADRLEFARKMHELITYHKEGIFSDSEFEEEVERLKSTVKNEVAIDHAINEEVKKSIAEELKRKEEEQKRKEAAEEQRKAELLAYQKKNEEIMNIIEKEYAHHKPEIKSLTLEQINSANYDDILPIGELSHYDIIRYFVALGRADAAGKFYVDKFHLSAEDALQYLLAI